MRRRTAPSPAPQGIRTATRCFRTRVGKAATNPTDGDNKQLENFVTNYSAGATDQELKGSFFLSHHYFDRYADFGGGQR